MTQLHHDGHNQQDPLPGKIHPDHIIESAFEQNILNLVDKFRWMERMDIFSIPNNQQASPATVGFDVHLFKPFVDGSSEVSVEAYDACKTFLRIKPGLELHMVHNHLCRVQNKILLPYILTNCFEIRDDLYLRCYFVTQLAIGSKRDHASRKKKIPYVVKCLRVLAPTAQDDTFFYDLNILKSKVDIHEWERVDRFVQDFLQRSYTTHTCQQTEETMLSQLEEARKISAKQKTKAKKKKRKKKRAQARKDK